MSKKILVSLAIAAILLAGCKKKTAGNQLSPSPTPSASGQAVQVSPSPASSPSPQVDDLALIKAVLAAKLGVAADTLNVTISKKDATHAKGLVSTKGEETGGGYYLAAKVSGAWKIVYDGQATPKCSDIAPYNFTKDMVPECL